MKLYINRIPFWGIITFGFLFYFSSKFYPGGSQENLKSVGFDWVNNYWCNLMSKNGMNGEINSARPLAITAMTILCISLSVFFYQFAEFFAQNIVSKKIIPISGITSMVLTTFMFTDYHDLVTILSSLFGLIAVIGIIKEIYDSKLYAYKITGIISIFLLGINNLIYYSNAYIEWLPLIQKITLLIVLLWILGVNYEIRKKIKTVYNHR